MSGSSWNAMPPEYWLSGQDYWNRSLPDASGFFPSRRSLTFRGRMGDPWSFSAERFIGGPHGTVSFPSTAPPSHQLILINPRTLHSFPNTPIYNYEPAHNQTPPREESTLSKEEQDKALSKLRKQLYNPHLSGILNRLGAKSTSNEVTRTSRDQDDDGKRCAICLEDFKSKEFVMLTPCNHMFHEECIVRWVKSNGKCPVCRFVMVEKKEPPLNSSNNVTMRGGIDWEMISVIRAFNRAF